MYDQIRELLKCIAVKSRGDDERMSQEDKIIRLLHGNARILDEVDQLGRSLLIWASAYGNLSIVQYLISKQVNLNAVTHIPGHPDHGKTALYWAYERGYYDIVYNLVKAGAQDTGINNTFRQHHSRARQVGIVVIHIANHFLIHQATKDAQFTIVEALISRYPALLEQTNKEGETPLLLAARYAFERGLHYFIGQGADVNVATHRLDHPDDGKTVLHWVYERGSYKNLRMLMERGAVDTRAYGDYVIDKAVKDGRLDVIQLLVEFNPNFWEENARSISTWIGVASGRMVKDCFDGHKVWEPGWPDVVEYLLLNATSQGIEINQYLHKALAKSKAWLAHADRASSIFKLIENNANLDEAMDNPGHPNHGKTAVEWAYACKRFVEMGLLLDAGARVDYLLGRRLLFRAIESASVATIERLLNEESFFKYHQNGRFQHRAIHMLLDQDEFEGAQFPLILAVRKGYKNIACYLIKKGEDLNEVMNTPECIELHGKTALRVAYEAGQYAMVDLLIRAGAQDRAYRGCYLIHKAAYDGKLELVKQLLEGDSAWLNITDQQGKTPLDHAINGRHTSVYSTLIQAGALTQIQKEKTKAYVGSFSLFNASESSKDEEDCKRSVCHIHEAKI